MDVKLYINFENNNIFIGRCYGDVIFKLSSLNKFEKDTTERFNTANNNILELIGRPKSNGILFEDNNVIVKIEKSITSEKFHINAYGKNESRFKMIKNKLINELKVDYIKILKSIISEELNYAKNN